MRAKLPQYFRIAAVALFALTLIAIAIGYYRASSSAEFRMAGFPTELSKDVVASVSGYERRESDGETLIYYIKADKATTFADNHQELENVYVQLFAEGGSFDEITAQKAVYVPEADRNFKGYFAGDVVIRSRDQLQLRTQQITYSKVSETATADERIDFERANLRGSSFGGAIDLKAKRINLNKDVNFELSSDGEHSKLTAGSATYDQNLEQIDLSSGDYLEITGTGGKRSSARSQSAKISLVESQPGVRTLNTVGLSTDVEIEKTENGKLVKMRSGTANYHRPGERFELSNGAHIESVNDQAKTIATAANAIYEAHDRRVSLTGNGRIEQGADFVKADRMVATLFPQNTISKFEAFGNGHLHQSGPDSSIDISGAHLTSVFAEDGTLANSAATGESEIIRTANDGSRFVIASSKAATASFRGRGSIDSAQTDGRTTIRIEVPDNGSDSSNKSITADKIETKFQADGKYLHRAEATGNAVLVAVPHRDSVQNYKTQIEAPRFDCDFYSGTGNPQVCGAVSGTKTTRTPTVQRDGRGTQTMASERLTARFDERSGTLAQIDANGKARFTELDRKALADTFSFTAADEMLRLRGGEPTGWDSKVRTKAKEIDWDTRNEKSFFRGSVNATYYSSKAMKGSSPFGDGEKPVYFTADNCEVDHKNEIAVFSNNARGWQGNNYVRGAKIELSERDSRMSATGGVQSMLYQLKSKNSAKAGVPVFAAAAEMHYDGGARTIKYVRDVDIRQGQDRITGAAATIVLNEQNELVRTEAESGVSIVQAGRKAFAETAIYTVADDKLFLRGRPARIEDTQRGNSQGEELTLYLNDHRASGEGKSQVNPAGRVRSAYKVQ